MPNQKPEKIKPKDYDFGTYLTDGPEGPGWYHQGTTKDQVFIGHPGEPDYVLMDLGSPAREASTIKAPIGSHTGMRTDSISPYFRTSGLTRI